MLKGHSPCQNGILLLTPPNEAWIPSQHLQNLSSIPYTSSCLFKKQLPSNYFRLPSGSYAISLIKHDHQFYPVSLVPNFPRSTNFNSPTLLHWVIIDPGVTRQLNLCFLITCRIAPKFYIALLPYIFLSLYLSTLNNHHLIHSCHLDKDISCTKCCSIEQLVLIGFHTINHNFKGTRDVKDV